MTVGLSMINKHRTTRELVGQDEVVRIGRPHTTKKQRRYLVKDDQEQQLLPVVAVEDM